MIQVLGCFVSPLSPSVGAYRRIYEQGEGFTWAYLGLTIHEALKGVWFT